LLPPIINAAGRIYAKALKKLRGEWRVLNLPGTWKGALSGKRRKATGGKGSKRGTKKTETAAG
jgi:hypothetical protein